MSRQYVGKDDEYMLDVMIEAETEKKIERKQKLNRDRTEAKAGNGECRAEAETDKKACQNQTIGSFWINTNR